MAYRSNIQNSKLRKGVLPTKQIRDVKPAQGTIDTSALGSTDFAEATMTQFVSGHNGRNNPVATGRRYPAMATEEFAESTLTQHLDLSSVSTRLEIPKQAKALWKMVGNNLTVTGGAYTKKQAGALNTFLRSAENQQAADELMRLRNSDTPLTGYEQSRRYDLEKALANALTYLTRMLRAE